MNIVISAILLFALLFTAISATHSPVVSLQGGAFTMGIDDDLGCEGEYPSYATAVKPFVFDRAPITNEQFLAFRHSKPGFKSEAEQRGWSYVFSGYLSESVRINHKHLHAPQHEHKWMVAIENATFARPLGPESSIAMKLEHPVVHVSRRDAAAYCHYYGKRLSTEEEWEFAARGGHKELEYPWGDSYETGRTNLWQGEFPDNDTAADGWAGTSPVYAFSKQNDYGLFIEGLL